MQPCMHAEVCNEQLSLDNGVITYKPDNNLSTKPARTVAFLSCNEGYTLAGSARRVCQGSEGWTGLQPICYCEYHNKNIVCSQISVEPAATSCRVAYPGTGCTTNPNDPLLGPGGSNPRQCSCHISCFTDDDVDCCEDIGCVRTLRIPLDYLYDLTIMHAYSHMYSYNVCRGNPGVSRLL